MLTYADVCWQVGAVKEFAAVERAYQEALEDTRSDTSMSDAGV
jgi:hypothetical protein